jgi:hypothetical protein
MFIGRAAITPATVEESSQETDLEKHETNHVLWQPVALLLNTYF